MIWWVAQNAVVSALLAGAVAVACRVGRFSPAVKHALWLLVVVKLVTPPIAAYRVPQAFESGLRWLSENRPPPQPVVVEIVELSPQIVEELANDDPPYAEADLQDHFQDEPVLDGPARTEEEAPRVAMWLLLAWLAGAIPLAVVQLSRLVRLSRLARQATPPPDWLRQLVKQAAARLNVKPPAIAVVPAVCSPMVCALGRPRLLWPAALGDQLTPEALEAVLLHELAHLRRRDHWVAWLELFAGVAWWFNPIYWYVRWQLRENAELACDAWVVGILPSGRRAYAHALIEVTDFVSSAPAALPALALGNLARTSLERRLTMILRERMTCRVPLVGAVVIGLALLAVLPGFSRGQAPAADGPRKEAADDSGATADPNAFVEKGVAVLSDEVIVLSNEVPEVEASAVPQPPAAGEPPTGPANAAGPAAQPTGILPLGLQPPGAQPQTAGAGGGAPAGGPMGGPGPGGQPSGEEQRIAQLEAKLAQLLDLLQRRGIAEVDSLRAHPGPGMPGNMGGGMGVRHLGPQDMKGFAVNGPPANVRLTNVMGGPANVRHAKVAANHGDAEIETLTRARYKLPEGTAQPLSDFIRQHVTADVEVSVEGETLTVIASSEVQSRIAGFIHLVGKRPAPEADKKGADNYRVEKR